MNTKFAKPILLMLIITALVSTTFAQGMRGHGRQDGPPVMMLEKLNLSAEQQTQMQDLRYEHQEDMIGMRADLQSERLKLRRLVGTDEPNKKKIHAQIEKVGAAEIKIDKSRADHRLSMLTLLDDDQKKIFREGFHQRGGRFDGDRGDNRKDFRNHPRHKRF